VVVIGTEKADHFVITREGVYGAGLFVEYVRVQRVEVDGLEGDDHFYVLSTAPGVITTIVGGQGNDTYHVAGDVPTDTVVALGVQGVSGQVNHEVFSSDPAYDGIHVDGLRLYVATPDGGAVVVTLPPEQAVLYERDQNVAAYTITFPVTDGPGWHESSTSRCRRHPPPRRTGTVRPAWRSPSTAARRGCVRVCWCSPTTAAKAGTGVR
jgi:hypothetical protein